MVKSLQQFNSGDTFMELIILFQFFSCLNISIMKGNTNKKLKIKKKYTLLEPVSYKSSVTVESRLKKSFQVLFTWIILFALSLFLGLSPPFTRPLPCLFPAHIWKVTIIISLPIIIHMQKPILASKSP